MKTRQGSLLLFQASLFLLTTYWLFVPTIRLGFCQIQDSTVLNADQQQDKVNERNEVLLELKKLANSWDPANYNPYKLARIANRLKVLGKDTTFELLTVFADEEVAGIKDYDRDKLAFFLLTCLLKVPAQTGYLPDANLGMANNGRPLNMEDCPRFPIHVVNGIPLLLEPTNFWGFGPVLSISRHIDWIRNDVEWDPEPFKFKTFSEEEVEATIDEFIDSEACYYSPVPVGLELGKAEMKNVLRKQIRRYLESVEKHE